ncbi:MAG TPA: response regulator [Cytophagaceae bacterium]|jgi:CheY-like chemotaxis protein|nr:response regulator [Cytophagaceae bacterium]
MKNDLSAYISVLLADDDIDDRMIFSDAVSELNINVDLQVVKDGAELMNYLLTSAVILPEIIFLDLNMPRKNGFECLDEIKKHPVLKDIFIIIYSTTESQKEIDDVFRQQANLFIKKPNSFTELKKTLSQLLTTNLKKEYQTGTKEQFIFRASHPSDKKKNE